MQIDLFSLFPAMFESYLQESILKRAQQAGLLTIGVHNIREWATDKHHVTDDTPYGGGGGMVMKPDPIFAAVESVLGLPPQQANPESEPAVSDSALNTPHREASRAQLRVDASRPTPHLRSTPSAVGEGQPLPSSPSTPIILLAPTGRLFTQTVARELSAYPRLAFICGRYEGVDERVRAHLATDEISIGDFVVTGGELPAMLIVDAIARHIPGVLGAENAVADDSHASGLLEYPHYTRPPEFRGWPVPDILQSGDHARIARWRREESLRRTFLHRPDLLDTAELSEADRKFLKTLKK
jgi:tRNA (guanine37-N1)-methyltransferase